jgi:pyoverdine/dityrosine biosynthesis protein Dit1
MGELRMNNLKLYYPSVTSEGKPIDQMLSNKVYKQLCYDICEISGGLTVTPCSGMYVNSLGTLISDDISLISVYTDKLDQMIKIMHENAMIILKSLNQESVMIEVNNNIEFIT